MIIRVWRGWTTLSNAGAYQDLLITTIFPGIAAREIPGFLGIRLDRRLLDGEVEFVTTMIFATEDAVVVFAGKSHERSVVPAAAQMLLSRYDANASHYELIAGMGFLTPPALVSPSLSQTI